MSKYCIALYVLLPIWGPTQALDWSLGGYIINFKHPLTHPVKYDFN